MKKLKLTLQLFFLLLIKFSVIKAEDFDVQIIPSLYSGGYNISCYGETTGSISLFISGGIAPYSYQWLDGSTLRNRKNLAAGYYRVTITSSTGQRVTREIYLKEPEPFQAVLYAEEYKGSYTVSEFGASDGFISAEIKGGVPPYNFLWSNGASEQKIGKLPAGSYNLLVTDATNCSTSTSITLIEPTPFHLVSITSPTIGNTAYNTSCGMRNGAINLTVAGGTPPYTYKWSNGAFSQNLIDIEAGRYKVQATDANQSEIIASIDLYSSPTVEAQIIPFVFPNGFNTSCYSCSNGSIALTNISGEAPFIFSWNNGQTSQTCNNLSAGFYEVNITDALGCRLNEKMGHDIRISAPDREDWTLNGNVNYDTSKFIGTTNASDLVFKSNNIESIRLAANNSIHIGNSIAQSNIQFKSPAKFSKLITATAGIALNDSKTEKISFDSSATGKYINFGQTSPKLNTCIYPSFNGVKKNYLFDGFIASRPAQRIGNVNAALIVGSAPWDGSGIIEVEGSDSIGGTNNGLLLNYFCGRNISLCTNPAVGGVVSTGSFFEVGYPYPRNSGIAANINGRSQIGLRVTTRNSSINALHIPAYNTQLLVENFQTKIIGGFVYNPGGYEQAVFSIKGNGETIFGVNTAPALFIKAFIDSNNFQNQAPFVGIGTNNPLSSLHVKGEVRSSSLADSTSIYNLLQANSDGIISKVNSSTLNDLGLWQKTGGNIFRPSGQVGIGNNAPNGDLQVGDFVNRVSMGNFWNGKGPWVTSYIGFNAGREKIQGAIQGAQMGTWTINGAKGLANGASVIASSLSGDIRFLNFSPDSLRPELIQHKNDDQILAGEKMIIRSDGKVGIGLPTNYNGNFKLYVKGGIISDRMKVAVDGSPEWMDIVFDKNYPLKSLDELAVYIQKNNHLPEIPSTSEVIKDGLDLGLMQKKSIQKIEELTLYILQQNQRIAALEKILK